jgi:hypothetical protein
MNDFDRLLTLMTIMIVKTLWNGHKTEQKRYLHCIKFPLQVEFQVFLIKNFNFYIEFYISLYKNKMIIDRKTFTKCLELILTGFFKLAGQLSLILERTCHGQRDNMPWNVIRFPMTSLD